MLLRESWKVLREEAADLIQRYGGKVTQSVSKKKSQVVVGQDPGRVNFPRYIVMHSSKEGKKRTVNITIYTAPFP